VTKLNSGRLDTLLLKTKSVEEGGISDIIETAENQSQVKIEETKEEIYPSVEVREKITEEEFIEYKEQEADSQQASVSNNNSLIENLSTKEQENKIKQQSIDDLTDKIIKLIPEEMEDLMKKVIEKSQLKQSEVQIKRDKFLYKGVQHKGIK